VQDLDRADHFDSDGHSSQKMLVILALIGENGRETSRKGFTGGGIA
jgi:hypothetical protein